MGRRWINPCLLSSNKILCTKFSLSLFLNKKLDIKLSMYPPQMGKIPQSPVFMGVSTISNLITLTMYLEKIVAVYFGCVWHEFNIIIVA